jgi:hypothetical protein
MNMNTHTSTHELYRNRDNSPLDKNQIRRVAPSVFADREDDSRSEKYRFVSSDSLLDQMEEAGFLVVGAQEQRTRKPDGTPTRKHLIRFAHRDVLEHHRDQRIEVVMINSHNGSCSYQLMAGIFRLVCTNGLIVGARIAAINIRHMGHTGEDVIAASLQLASETPRIMDDIHRMQGVELPYRRQVDFVHEAAQLRMGDDYEDRIRPEALLSPRRWNDIGFTAGGPATVWQCFNRVQENLIRGGVPLKPQKDGVYRRRSLRALNGIDGNTHLNRELWDLADSYTLNN